MDAFNSSFRELAHNELALFFMQLMKDHSEGSISAHIFSAVEQESLAPTVLAVWLSIARTPSTLMEALRQEFSVSTRKMAINRLFKLLRRARWRETWDGVGGTQGLLSLLKGFSVSEVKLCLSLLPSSLNHHGKTEKRIKVDELLQGLFPLIYTDSTFKNSDARPLVRLYQRLLPGCTEAFVYEVLRDKENPFPRTGAFDAKMNSMLLRNHYKILRRLCLERIFTSTYTGIDVDHYLKPLLTNTPGLPNPEQGISESMAFSILVLRKLVSEPKSKIGVNVLTGLIEPLLERVRKKKRDRALITEILDLSTKYLSSHPDVAKALSFDRNRFLHRCIAHWASSSTYRLEGESPLVSILRLIPSDQIANGVQGLAFLSWVPIQLRYDLLKLLFLHIGNETIDIDDTESLQERQPKRWRRHHFFLLDRDKAVDLLKRLRGTSLKDDFLVTESGLLSLSTTSYPLSPADSSILLNLLEEGQPRVVERAASAVEEKKRKAATSREQVDRAFFAKSALFFAISSGSLELYSDTLIWARRFVRDPLTVKVIFARDVTATDEGLRLLSGIPNNFEGLEPSDIARSIQASNRTIFEMFETVCSALKEPSFWRQDWDGPLELIGKVVHKRVTLGKLLQDTLNLTDDQFYNLIYRDTLDLVLRIEKIGLQPGYEPLQLQNPSGLLSIMSWESAPSFRFVDNLAKERDSLWREFRPTLKPAVAALPRPLPRGLPVQCLAPWYGIAVEAADGLTPFIFSRAEAVVFAEPTEANFPIPEDDETRSAIGTFVDSFDSALKIYVLQGESHAIRQSRMMRAWEHAMDNLSGRMTPEEARRTWRLHFLRFQQSHKRLPQLEMDDLDPKINMEYPLFPFDADVGQYTEWNPAEDLHLPAAIESRQLRPLTYLDCTIATSPHFHPTASGEFKENYQQTQGFNPQCWSIWSLERLSRKQVRIPAVREGMIVSALLYLEHHIRNHRSILLKPFPSATDIRYPDMWLDLSFISVKGVGSVNDDEAFGILERLLFAVPPTLLYKLTEASIDAILNAPPEESHGNIARSERLAFGFLLLLAKSDRPSLAINLVLKAVIERPDSSSWHRQLLKPSFLRSLSAIQAKDFIQSFADAIQKRTKETVRISEEATNLVSGRPQTVRQPYIKVTTVKYLAQILQDANFVPESFAIDVLSGLFKESTHLDIRVEIVKSLIEILAKCQHESSNLIGEQVLQVLKFTIPIAGSFDERHQLQEEDWEEAKRTGNLSLIYNEVEESSYSHPPILSVLSNAIGTATLESRWQERLLEQIILPILETSTAANTRWLELFTAKHNLDLHSLSLPLLPVHPPVLINILRRYYYDLPSSLMDLYHKYVITNISPPEEVRILNDKFREPTLFDLPEVQHWLYLYGVGPGVSYQENAALRQNWVFPKSSITIAQLQSQLYEQAKLLLSVNRPNVFNMFIKNFEPRPGSLHRTDWLKNAKPVLQRIITLIDSMRTPEWQGNPKRQPEQLPSTLRFKLWLLPYTDQYAEEADFSRFADAVRGFVSNISKTENPYHMEMKQILDALKLVLPAHLAPVACLLGTLREDLSLVDLLCVDIARELFEKVTPKTIDESITEDSKSVIQSWLECANEGVRRAGTKLSSSKGLFHNPKVASQLFD